MPPLCTICNDDEVEVLYECASAKCEYNLCAGCLEDAFKDVTGANSRTCPLCHRPSAIRMAEARIGKGGVKAVQRELRETVELEVRQEHGLYAADKKHASEANEEALKLFHSVSEKLNLTCPKCKMAFHDYEGCNALTCANAACQAKFCAICLKDCGSDAHAHVRQEHGNLFDKAIFEKSRNQRFADTIENYLDELEVNGKSFEVRQLVRNHLERAGQLGGAKCGFGSNKCERFLAQASRDLERVIASDRLSVLSSDHGRGQSIQYADISPRAVIPSDVLIFLHKVSDGYKFVVQALIENKWVTAASPEQLNEWIKTGMIASSGCLANLDQSIRCAVIAIEGERRLYQVKQRASQVGSTVLNLSFSPIDRYGEVGTDENIVLHGPQLRILALNPNDRYLRLLQHIKSQVNSSNFPLPLKHFIGEGEPVPVFFDLVTAVPKELASLNDDQRLAGHPLCLKTAGEVAGPPGTGKTKTISELVRALLRCTTKDIVVLSERNGAIDAIAEKFSSLCIGTVGGNYKVTNMSMWKDIVTFGSFDAMGKHSRLFLIEEKIKYHPEILEAMRKERECKEALMKLGRKLQGMVADEVQFFGDKFDDALAWNQHVRIRSSNEDDLKSPRLLREYMKKVMKEASELMEQLLSDDRLQDFIKSNSAFVQNLFPMEFRKGEVARRLQDLSQRLSRLLKADVFAEGYAEEFDRRHKESQEARQATETRVKEELDALSRLKMSTIGSSHKLFPKIEKVDGDVVEAFRQLAIREEKDGAIVIFDESGCIPSYELLGLSRLDCEISAILCVGDKKQLSPYNPSNGKDRKGRMGQENEEGLRSLLDVSEVKEKVALRTQYRVPRDIAQILDTRVYKGMYQTPRGTVCEKGLAFWHVSKSNRQERKRYVNSDEVEVVLRLAVAKVEEGFSIMILTPYKNQQREIQFQLKRKGITSVPEASVLTIDQCQGQEADVVIFTLVQRPTRFLNKNRLNVAMSRTKRELIFVADRLEFRAAAKNSAWDCALMANDVIAETTVHDGSI